MSEACSFLSLFSSLGLQSPAAPFLQAWRGHPSQEGLMTFRGDKKVGESLLHPPCLRFLQLTVFNKPRCPVWGSML